MVWTQLDLTKAHIAYAVIGVFTFLFSLCSLFVKEKLFIGEASFATLYGLIVGPHCLNWFNPLLWGNYFYNTIELARILLCIDIVASSVELPKRYIWKHGVSVITIMFPCMICGWLIIALFIWIVIPGCSFVMGLVISACVTATDPVLAAAVVGQGPFAKRVPAHIRHLLICESACNDGMSVPFVFLALNLLKYGNNARLIVKNWLCISVLYMCVFGLIFGAIVGYVARKLAQFAERFSLINKSSLLAFYITIALICAGFGSMLGFDDLLASFAAGAAFAWDGWVSEKTEDSDASTVIDLLLNISFFIYFGSIVPWQEFNNGDLGLDIWRLIIIALVVLILRRLPASLIAQYFCPDIKNWKEALLVGHFGPIGVSALFGCIIAISELEAEVLNMVHGPSINYPESHEHYQLIRILWPIVTFMVLISIIVHGSSVPIMIYSEYVKFTSFETLFSKGIIDEDKDLDIGSGIECNKSVINENLKSSNSISEQTMDLTRVDSDGLLRVPTTVYNDGNMLVIEDQLGEVVSIIDVPLLKISRNSVSDNHELLHGFGDNKHTFFIDGIIYITDINGKVLDSISPIGSNFDQIKTMEMATKYYRLKESARELGSSLTLVNEISKNKKGFCKYQKEINEFIDNWKLQDTNFEQKQIKEIP